MAPRTTLEVERPAKSSKGAKRTGNGAGSAADRERIFDAFRRWGYLEASLDPLGFLGVQPGDRVALLMMNSVEFVESFFDFIE